MIEAFSKINPVKGNFFLSSNYYGSI